MSCARCREGNTMKLGFNLLLWTPHVTLAHEPILRALKKTGYDGVEIPMFEGDPDHYARLGELLDRIGLARSVVSVETTRSRARCPPRRMPRSTRWMPAGRRCGCSSVQ